MLSHDSVLLILRSARKRNRNRNEKKSSATPAPDCPQKRKKLTSPKSTRVSVPDPGADDNPEIVPATISTEPLRTSTLLLSPARSKSTSRDARRAIADVLSTPTDAAASGVWFTPASQSGPSRDKSVREAVIESVRVWMFRPTVKKGIDNPSVDELSYQ